MLFLHKINVRNPKVANPSIVFLVALYELKNPAKDRNFPRDSDGRAEMLVRAWKCVNTLTLGSGMFYLTLCNHI